MNDPRLNRIALGFLNDDSPVERFDCPRCEAAKYVDVRHTWWECDNCYAIYFVELLETVS